MKNGASRARTGGLIASFLPGEQETMNDEIPQGENDVEETPGPGTEVFGIDVEGSIGVD